MTSTKNIWKGIKQIITLKPQSLSFPNKIQVDNVQISNPNDIAKEFNNFFANIGSKLASSINSGSSRSYFDYLSEPQRNSFFLFPTITTEIEKIIRVWN